MGGVVLVACSQPKAPKSIATAWQDIHLQSVDDPFIRSIASNNAKGMCLANAFTVDNLKKEVAQYESKVSGRVVTGTWKHLDLSNLPIPQANFLKKYGTKIGDIANPDSIDYSGCNDVPCIFNRVYNKGSNNIAGYVHYLWFLKFGHYLSADNMVPDQRSPIPGVYGEKNYQVTDYLYDNNELYALWRVTHLLKEPYTNLSNLNEVQRIPRGVPNFEGYQAGACGLASVAGHIRLQDGCLTTGSINKDTGFMYIGVIHEMTHMLDSLQAKQNRSNQYYRSYDKDYLDLVGFYKNEYTDANGKLVSEWKLKPEAKTIRDYAATSPVENFADTLAYFRQEGDRTKTKIDDVQYNWVSGNYFHGDSYDKRGNRERLLKKYESAFAAKTLNKVMDCTASEKPYQSNYFSAADFNVSTVSPWVLRCLSYEAQLMASDVTGMVKIYEADGCSTLETTKDQADWDLLLKSSLKENFKTYVVEMSKDPAYIEKMKSFNNLLSSRRLANEAFFQCFKGSVFDDLKSCYDDKVIRVASAEAVNIGLPESHAQELGALYSNAHSYSRVSSELYDSYKNLLASNEESIALKSEDSWQMCLNMNHNDDIAPSGTLFTPAKGYLVSSFFNCLNAQLPTVMTEFVRELEFNGQKVVHPIEEQIILEFLKPKMVTLLRGYHESAMAEEAEELPVIFSQDADKIREFLVSDFSWVTSLTDKSLVMSSCRNLALGQVTFLPLYHLKREAFSSLIMNGPCQDALQDEGYTKFIDASQKEVDNQIFSKIESLLEAKAEERALHCKSIIPWKWEKTRVTVRVPRKACLSMGWSDVEKKTVEELLNDSVAKRFNMKKSDIAQKVSSYEEVIKERISEKHF